MSRELLRSTGVVGLMTLLSRILGFVRDVLQASLFGAGAAMDAFFIAFRIPNLFRRMFAEGAFSQAFVPVLSEARQTQSPEAVRELVSVVSGTLAGVLLMLTAVCVAGAPLLISLFAPGFADEPEKFAQAVTMLRWTFPYLLFVSLVALCAGVLNAWGRFGAPAFAPVWLNVCLIVAALAFAPNATALAIAVFAAGVVQLLFLLPYMARIGMLVRPRWGLRDPRVRRILFLMAPIMFGSSIGQLSLLVDSIIASFLPRDGSVSWLWFADRLMEFPLGTFSIAIATVILPALARQHASASGAEFSATLDWALRMVLLVGLPAALGLFVLALPLVATLFGHGRFDAEDVRMTAVALQAYALGFMGFSLVKVLVPGYFARQDARTPVRCGVIALCCGMAMSACFVLLLLWLDHPAPHAGIALATGLSAWLNAVLLYRGLRRDGVHRPAADWGPFGLRLVLACAGMVALLGWQHGSVEFWLQASVGERAVQLALLVCGGAAAYFALLGALGLRPAHLSLRG